jgi:hypothetical protein
MRGNLVMNVRGGTRILRGMISGGETRVCQFQMNTTASTVIKLAI